MANETTPTEPGVYARTSHSNFGTHVRYLRISAIKLKLGFSGRERECEWKRIDISSSSIDERIAGFDKWLQSIIDNHKATARPVAYIQVDEVQDEFRRRFMNGK